MDEGAEILCLLERHRPREKPSEAEIEELLEFFKKEEKDGATIKPRGNR